VIESVVGIDSTGEPLTSAGRVRDGSTLSQDGAQRHLSAGLAFILAREPARGLDPASIAGVASGLLCSNREFALGPVSALRDITNLGVLVSFSGLPAQTTSTAAIEGGPLAALQVALDRASDQGITLGPGSVILALLPTSIVPPPATVVAVEIEGLGRVRVIA
jgi:hypothetical protein